MGGLIVERSLRSQRSFERDNCCCVIVWVGRSLGCPIASRRGCFVAQRVWVLSFVYLTAERIEDELFLLRFLYIYSRSSYKYWADFGNSPVVIVVNNFAYASRDKTSWGLWSPDPTSRLPFKTLAASTEIQESLYIACLPLWFCMRSIYVYVISVTTTRKLPWVGDRNSPEWGILNLCHTYCMLKIVFVSASSSSNFLALEVWELAL